MNKKQKDTKENEKRINSRYFLEHEEDVSVL